MRILFLATNAEFEASTRFRVMQWLPVLRAAGHDVSTSFFFESPAGPRWRRAIGGGVRRIHDIRNAGDYDLVVVHRELMPFAHNELAPWIARRTSMAFDFDDAVYLPRTGTDRHLSAPQSTKLVVKASRIVFAGNANLAKYAASLNTNTVVLPTVVDTNEYVPVPHGPRAVPRVGWIGSPTTSPYLARLFPLLDDVARRIPFELHLTGYSGEVPPMSCPVVHHQWRADDEHARFADLDVGLYPLPDDEWTRGKCGLKAIQYMASGVPAVVSAVGVVRDIVGDHRDGFWADDDDAWKSAITTLLADGSLRKNLATSARNRAVDHFSMRAVAGMLLAGLESAVV